MSGLRKLISSRLSLLKSSTIGKNGQTEPGENSDSVSNINGQSNA